MQIVYLEDTINRKMVALEYWFFNSGNTLLKKNKFGIAIDISYLYIYISIYLMGNVFK